MSDINFCNTKEQLNHLGEVVTGKVNGSPTGADIDTSTLPYTGQVRKTLPALEDEYQADIDNFVQVSDQVIVEKSSEFDASIANKEAEADSAIDAYRLLSKGPYAAGILLEDKFQYITYNGESYFAKNPPYTTTATTPDADGNLFAGGYLTSQQLSLYTDIVYKASGGNSAVENMVAGVPIAAKVGDKCTTGGTTWERVSNAGGDISDFHPLSSVEASDFSPNNVDQTSGCNECAALCIANEYTMSMIGKYRSDKIVFDGDINLITSCIVNSVNDVDVFEFKNGKVMHSGTCEVIGVNREGDSTGVTFESSLASTMGTFEITNVALGVDYKSIGNNNLITWEKLRCYNTGWFYLTSYTKGVQVSPPNIYNVGEITTPTPIRTRTGVCLVNGKSYPLLEKQGAANTYYIGGFNEIPSIGTVRHFSGGGVLHQKSNDNGAIIYDKLMLLSCRGISICTQAFYGVTVSGGEIEGCQANAVVGGIFDNGVNDPRTILSIRSNFTGIHTEANEAPQPLVYSLSQSGVNFGGNLIRTGVRGTASGFAFQRLEGEIVTTNDVSHLNRDTSGSSLIPISPGATIYRNANINGIATNVTLRDLKTGIDLMGDGIYEHHSKLTIGLYDLPAGQTHNVTFTPEGSNTVNGGTSPVVVPVVGVAGKTLIEVYAILVGDDFTIMIP